MVSLEKIDNSMFPEIYTTFLKDDDPSLSESSWSRLFVDSPESSARRSGYALVDRGRIVGVLGMLLSQRMIDGRPHKFCNLHNWFVEDAFRGRSLFLLRPALALKDHTLTDFTPTAKVCEISRRLGFRDLEARLRLLLLPRKGLARPSRQGVDVIHDAGTIVERLGQADRQIMKDHGFAACRHMLISDGAEHCYIVYSRVNRWRIPYCYVHYISNKELFARHAATCRAAFSAETGTRFAAVDSRAVSGVRLPMSFQLPIGSRQLYRPADAPPERIDSLYSELVLLNLTTFPNLSGKLRNLRTRLMRGDRKPPISALQQ